MYISFATKIDLATCEHDCQFAVDHHISAVDVLFTDSAQPSMPTVKALRNLLNAYGLRCASFVYVGLNHLVAEATQRHAMHAQRARACEYAALLGASTFVTSSGRRSHVLDENAYMFAQELHATVTSLRSHGIRFAIQPDSTGFVDSLTAFERVWSLMGQVYGVFDPVALRMAGDDAVAFVRKHVMRIAHVRVTDVLMHDGHRIATPPAGMGDIRWGALIGLLYEGGYDGALSITPEGSFWGRANQRQRMILLSQHHLHQFLFDDDETILATKSASFYGRMV